MKKNIYVSFVLLASINFWSFQGDIFNSQFKILQLLISISFIFCIIKFRKKTNNMYFKKYVLLFMLLPFLGVIPCYFIHGQQIYLTIWVLRVQLCWLFYFVLHRLQISEKEILKIFVFIAFIWVLIELVQQFTYPKYYFYTRGDTYEKDIEIRAGIYRYMTAGIYFAVFVLYYYLQKVYDSREQRWKNVLWILFFLFGIYLNMTRQTLFAVLLCIFIAPLLLQKFNIVKKYLFFCGGILLAGTIYYFKDVLWGELIENTENQLNEDNIRVASYLFYLNYWDHWSCFFLGNGLPHETSFYGNYISYIEEDLHLFRSDVGIIGELSNYGIIYIIVYIVFCFNYFWKSKAIKLYLKLYLIFTLLIVLMIFPFRYGSEFLFFSVFLYLCDLSLKRASSKVSNSIKNDDGEYRRFSHYS